MPQLTKIITIEATLELKSGLRIGAGDSEMRIGGVDNCVIRHPHSQQPYIPGSSLKGKIRSLLEWRSGAVKEGPLEWSDYEKNKPIAVKRILQLFGISGDAKVGLERMQEIGPSRLSFWDCSLEQDWSEEIRENNQPLLEIKTENRINRISGVAEHPRQTERVPAGARFGFCLSVKRLLGDGEDLLDTTLEGMKLLELDSLGGSGSRGYGKVGFKAVKIDGIDAMARYEAAQPFPAVKS